MSRIVMSLALIAGVFLLPSIEGIAQTHASAKALPKIVNTLKIDTLKEGEGDAIATGSTAVVHYTGWLYDPQQPDGKGEKFDSSQDSGDPFRFALGGGHVIKGWEQGVEGMMVGEQRRLTIPADLAYGNRGAAGGTIPPGAVLVFDVELLGIE